MIVKEKRQVQYWTEYKNKGQHDHKTQIMLLERELVDMQTSYDEMSGIKWVCNNLLVFKLMNNSIEPNSPSLFTHKCVVSKEACWKN